MKGSICRIIRMRGKSSIAQEREGEREREREREREKIRQARQADTTKRQNPEGDLQGERKRATERAAPSAKNRLGEGKVMRLGPNRGGDSVIPLLPVGQKSQ